MVKREQPRGEGGDQAADSNPQGIAQQAAGQRSGAAALHFTELKGHDQSEHGGKAHLERGRDQRRRLQQQHPQRGKTQRTQRKRPPGNQDRAHGQHHDYCGPLGRYCAPGNQEVAQRPEDRRQCSKPVTGQPQAEARDQRRQQPHQKEQRAADHADVQPGYGQQVGEARVADLLPGLCGQVAAQPHHQRGRQARCIALQVAAEALAQGLAEGLDP